MAKFKFYQDKEVTTWVRDYFEVEAESLDEAVKWVEDMNCSLEIMERQEHSKAEFSHRDWDWMHDALCDLCDQQVPETYFIFSCDLEDAGKCDEVIGKRKE